MQSKHSTRHRLFSKGQYLIDAGSNPRQAVHSGASSSRIPEGATLNVGHQVPAARQPEYCFVTWRHRTASLSPSNWK